MSAERLREMLSEATPSVDLSVADYRKGRDRLDALGPDAIALLARADELFLRDCDDGAREHCPTCEWRADLDALCGDER